jgi:vacuolar protein sorting-associated protein 33A
MQDATIGDLKQLVNKDVKGHLTVKKLLTRHLDLCTDIYEKKKANDFKIQLEMEADMLHSQNFDDVVSYIHTMICRCEPDKYRPLQLLCLLSTSNNGLTRECYELLCRSYLQAYGYEYIPLLYKLEQLNLFHVKRPSDMPLATNNNTSAGSRSEALLKIGKQVAQNLTDKTQAPKTLFQFMRKRLNLILDHNQQMKSVPGPDMVGHRLQVNV